MEKTFRQCLQEALDKAESKRQSNLARPDHGPKLIPFIPVAQNSLVIRFFEN